MTQEELSAKLREAADKIDLVDGTVEYGNVDQMLTTAASLWTTLKAWHADGTLKWAADFARRSADRTLILKAILALFGTNQGDEMAKTPMTATQASQAKSAMTSAGCSDANAQSILDWFTNLGLDFPTIMNLINAAIALVQGGVTWAKVMAFIQLVVAAFHPAPPTPPVIVP